MSTICTSLYDLLPDETRRGFVSTIEST